MIEVHFPLAISSQTAHRQHVKSVRLVLKSALVFTDFHRMTFDLAEKSAFRTK